jgi:hypothetical protein
MKLLIHASGYKLTPWKSDQQEILATLDPKCGGNTKVNWAPSSRDFAAVGHNSGGSLPAASIDELLKVISQQSIESIEELRILGHASNDWGLYLAGDIKNDTVYFDNHDDASIGDLDADDPFRKAMPKFRELQDRFTADAKVVLMGCHSGGVGGVVGGLGAVVSLVSHAFLRTVGGFKDEITLDFTWWPIGKAVYDGTGNNRTLICNRLAPNSRVTLRGKMRYGDPNAPYQMNAWLLNPEVFSNDGDIFVAVRRKDPGAGSTELAWRIMKEFYENHPYVSGTSVGSVPELPKHVGLVELIRQDMKRQDILSSFATTSLRVRKQGGGMFIDINPDSAKKTTPATLKNRVAEMGHALALVGKKQEGVIPFK